MSCSFELNLKGPPDFTSRFSPRIHAYIGSNSKKPKSYVCDKGIKLKDQLFVPNDCTWAVLVIEIYCMLPNHQQKWYYNKQGFVLVDLRTPKPQVIPVRTIGVMKDDEFTLCGLTVEINSLFFPGWSRLIESGFGYMDHDALLNKHQCLVDDYNKPLQEMFNPFFDTDLKVSSVFTNGSLFHVWMYYQTQTPPKVTPGLVACWLRQAQMLLPSGKSWDKIALGSLEHYDFIQLFVGAGTISMYYTDDSVYMPQNDDLERDGTKLLHVDSYDRAAVCMCGDCEDRAKSILETFYALQSYIRVLQGELKTFFNPLLEYTGWTVLVGDKKQSKWAHIIFILIEPCIIENKPNEHKHPILIVDSIYPSLTRFQRNSLNEYNFVSTLNKIKKLVNLNNPLQSDKRWPRTDIRTPLLFNYEWSELYVYCMYGSSNQYKGIHSIFPYRRTDQAYGELVKDIACFDPLMKFKSLFVQDSDTSSQDELVRFHALFHPVVEYPEPPTPQSSVLTEGVGFFVDGDQLKDQVTQTLTSAGFSVYAERTSVELQSQADIVWLLRCSYGPRTL